MVEAHKFILFVTIVARYIHPLHHLHVRQLLCHGSFLHAINGIPHPIPNPQLEPKGITAIQVVPVSSGEGRGG